MRSRQAVRPSLLFAVNYSPRLPLRVDIYQARIEAGAYAECSESQH
ncbi:hypothetical protein D8I24_7903 [Cupriavidus necator H850]|nr:hypothetical protein D8I24_7903 [Cupriavidus necator H850]